MPVVITPKNTMFLQELADIIEANPMIELHEIQSISSQYPNLRPFSSGQKLGLLVTLLLEWNVIEQHSGGFQIKGPQP